MEDLLNADEFDPLILYGGRSCRRSPSRSPAFTGCLGALRWHGAKDYFRGAGPLDHIGYCTHLRHAIEAMQRAPADRIEVILGDAVTSAVGGKLTPAVATMVSNMSVGEGTP